MRASRVTLVLVVAACGLLGAAAPTGAASKGLKVMVTGSCFVDEAQPTATAIAGQPGIASAKPFDTSIATPSATALAAVDLVVNTGDNCGPSVQGGYENAALYGNRLATYVDHGGVVLQAAYDNWDRANTSPAGRFASGGYAPLEPGNNDNFDVTLGQVLKPKSPIVQGLGTFHTTTNTTTALAAGATLLAKWSDGRNAIAVKGRVVATSASVDDDSALVEIARLARNTALYFNFVPTTKITKSTVNESAGTAAFRFKALGASTGFVCALATAGKKATFTPCRSHKTYMHLKPGGYTFEAAAVGLGGPDQTPAKMKFRITS